MPVAETAPQLWMTYYILPFIHQDLSGLGADMIMLK